MLVMSYGMYERLSPPTREYLGERHKVSVADAGTVKTATPVAGELGEYYLLFGCTAAAESEHPTDSDSEDDEDRYYSQVCRLSW